MKGSKVYRTILLITGLVIAMQAVAQPGVQVSATADRNKILIGEQILLTLKADIPENEAISFFNFDSIAHFELIDPPVIDTINTNYGTVLTLKVRITSFDSGHWVIPQFILRDSIMTDSIPVDVGYTTGFDPAKDYNDIKDILEVDVEKEKSTWWYYAIGGALLLAALAFYLSKRKKKAVVAIPATPIDPYADAMKRLDELQKQKPATKEYYSAVVDIFRLYVSRKKGIHSLQKTTDDIIVQLNSIGMNRQNFDRLSQSLRLSDFVKFAKYIPTSDDDQEILQSIKQSIQEIEQQK